MKRLLLAALIALPISAMAGLKGTPEGCDNYASNIQFLATYRDKGWSIEKTAELVNTYDYSQWGDGKMTPRQVVEMKGQFLKELAELYGPEKGIKAIKIYINRYASCMGSL